LPGVAPVVLEKIEADTPDNTTPEKSQLRMTNKRSDSKRLRDAEHFLAAIVESCLDSIITIDLDGVITTWNRSAERLYGYPANEAVGRPLTLLTLPEDLQQVLGKIDDIRNGRPVEIYDTVRVRKDGRHITLEILLSPVKNDAGQVIGASTIARDVTEQRRVHEELRASEERLRLMLECARDYAIFTLDPERKVTSWHSGAQTMFGYTGEEIIGQSGDVMFVPEDREQGAPVQEVEKAANEGRAENERWHMRKDGSRFYGSGLTHPLRNGAGEIIGFVKIMRDLTQQKQNEEAMRQRNEELERFNKAAVGRELRMVELKKEVNELAKKAGERPRYEIPGTETSGKRLK
jgi:two-component system, chemotaxis family, CheB/CheR fusion protein